MTWLNAFAQVHGLRVHTSWSKVWEYPWIWGRISDLPLNGLKVLDIGSELSPFPWFLSSLGARVWMVEKDASFVALWEQLKKEGGFQVDWRLVDGALLPFDDSFFDLVLSFSVLEHIPDKEHAIDEAVRVLKPGGRLGLTFDICELKMGMSYPAWGGEPLDMEEADSRIAGHPSLEPVDPAASWNTADISDFVKWHLQSSPHHNYTVGGAVLTKKRLAAAKTLDGKLQVHALDTGVFAGNLGDDAMYLGGVRSLPGNMDASFEVHDVTRASRFGCSRPVFWQDLNAIRRQILSSDAVLLMAGTPIMEDWGLEWPLRSNAWKLECCHQAGILVHAAGIGVDLLRTPQALEIFSRSYLPIASWTVRSTQCLSALVQMGVPPERISVGADWVWVSGLAPDPAAAVKWRTENPTELPVRRVGVNLVSEIWTGDSERARQWSALLDRLYAEHICHFFFFCNESRDGEYYDAAAAREVMALMRAPATLVPNLYYHPSEMVSMLSTMDLTISLRYHFTTFSLLAGVPCLSVTRGQKMQSLNADLGLPFVGDAARPAREALLVEATKALADPQAYLRELQIAIQGLKLRATSNLALFERSLAEGDLHHGFSH